MAEIRRLFDAAGLHALETALRARPLLAFDFDGTLAPLVDRPEDARVPEPLVQRLVRLGRMRPLAIVTGRAVGDVTQRLGFSAGYVVGNHGAEDRGTVSTLDTALLEPARIRVRGADAALRAAGVRLEDKRYSLALHFRQSADPAAAAILIDGLLADLPAALAVVPGKMVRNVVVADAPDKGDAVAALVLRAQCALAVFVGDDVNDETVFAKAPADWLTVRVGNDYPSSHAKYFLDGYSDVPELLDRMVQALEGN